MKIFRVNLPISTYSTEKFEVLNLPSNEVIHMRDFSDKDPCLSIDDRNYFVKYGFNLSESEILDYITHWKIWQDFLKMEDKYALIVESNTSLRVDYNSIVEFVATFPDDADIVFPFEILPSTDSGLNLINPNIREQFKHEPYILGYRLSNSIYLISRQGALKAIRMTTIQDRLDDSFLFLSATTDFSIYHAQVPWFEKKQISNKEWPDRLKNIWNYVMSNSFWNNSSKNSLHSLLHIISDCSKKTNTDLILQGGTHLGFVRHGCIMPWDDDVDLGLSECKKNLFFSCLSEYEDIKFGEFIEPVTNVPYYKIWLNSGTHIQGHFYRHPFVDIWFYKIDGDNILFRNGIICPNSAKYPFQKVLFEGEEFSIVGNSFEILDSRYVDWRSKVKVYSWSHSKERSTTFYLDIPIDVDENGRIYTY